MTRDDRTAETDALRPADFVVEPEDVARLGPVRLLDARGAEAHAAGALPGAVRVPLEDWIAAAGDERSGLADAGAWQERIAALGIGPGVRALVHDGGEMTEAARVWFVLQYFGAEALVANGGVGALSRAALPPAAGPSAAPFVARPGAGRVGLIGREALRDALGGVAVLDARTPREHSGEDAKGNPRSGRIPGARLLPHGQLVRDGRLLPAAALRPMIEAAGFSPGDALVTHCQGGGRAALAALAALRAGYADVTVYYLSFGDWARDETCPVVR